MSSPAQRTFLQPITNVGVRRVMQAPHLTTEEPRRFQAPPVPEFIYFLSVSNLFRALFTSGDISKGDLDCEPLEDRMGIKFICVTQEFGIWWALNECLMNEWVMVCIVLSHWYQMCVGWGEREGKAKGRDAWGQGDGRGQDHHSSCRRSPFLLCVWPPNSGVKISTLPACGFSRRQPDLSPVSAQPQLLAFSRFSLPITGMVVGHRSHWPTETTANWGGWVGSEQNTERKENYQINKCLLKCLQNITLSQQKNAAQCSHS